MGLKALLEVRDKSKFSPAGLVGVGRPSQRSWTGLNSLLEVRGGREALPKVWERLGAIPEVWDLSGGPPGGLEQV